VPYLHHRACARVGNEVTRAMSITRPESNILFTTTNTDEGASASVGKRLRSEQSSMGDH
jgi:hypothetical protein